MHCCSSVIFIPEIKSLITLASRKRSYVLFLVFSKVENLKKIIVFNDSHPLIRVYCLEWTGSPSVNFNVMQTKKAITIQCCFKQSILLGVFFPNRTTWKMGSIHTYKLYILITCVIDSTGFLWSLWSPSEDKSVHVRHSSFCRDQFNT